jgi:ATP-dependent protease HslVU (ClpYQ) peptidase subunit
MGIGSGGSLALAAFLAGADAKKAVEIACTIDNLSGGKVYVHRLK